MIYLDNAATTPIAPEVYEAMLPYLKEFYGNPASKHYALAEKSAQAVKEAREKVAALVGANPSEIIFTSSASESNNFIIKGVADQLTRRHLITTVAEHSSSLGAFKYLETKGYEVTYLSIDSTAQISLEELRSAIRTDTGLISINWVNNEVGTIAPVADVIAMAKEQGIAVHLDATQAVGKLPVDVRALGVDYLSFSAHKIYGPKGIAAAFISEKAPIKKPTPLIHGGGQENDLRAGTLNVAGIVGFGVACSLLMDSQNKYRRHLQELDEAARQGLHGHHVRINGSKEQGVPGLISATIAGANNEILLRRLAQQVCASTGSACSSAAPSEVLLAMGIPPSEVKCTIRLSFGRFNSVADVINVVGSLIGEADRIRLI